MGFPRRAGQTAHVTRSEPASPKSLLHHVIPAPHLLGGKPVVGCRNEPLEHQKQFREAILRQSTRSDLSFGKRKWGHAPVIPESPTAKITWLELGHDLYSDNKTPSGARVSLVNSGRRRVPLALSHLPGLTAASAFQEQKRIDTPQFLPELWG